MATDGSVHQPGEHGRRVATKTSFRHIVDTWGRVATATDGAHLTSQRPWSWRFDDSHVSDWWAQRDVIDDRRVVARARQSAIDGDSPGARVYLRTVVGPASPTKPEPVHHDRDKLPPNVAAAMLEAGLEALGEDLGKVPCPVDKPTGRPNPTSNPDSPPAPPFSSMAR